MYGMLAGYQIESLKAQQQRLIAEKTTLAVEEARLLSPERLEESAQAQQFIEPAPDQVVFLHPKSDGSLALNVPSK
jgi:regulator of replication initiation timing